MPSPDAKRASRRRWYMANREHALEYARRYREDHLDEVLERTRRWRNQNREHIAEYSAARRAALPDEARLLGRRWFAENPEAREASRRRTREREAEVNAAARTSGGFSDSETRFVIEHHGDLTFFDIATALGRSHTSVRKKVERLRRAGLIA